MPTRLLIVLVFLSGMAPLATVGSGCRAPAPPTDPPHGIVLIVLDTLRADGLSAYGNPRGTSPTLDRLADDGVLFEKVVSHAAWTLPAFVGLLSGEYPSKRVFSEGRLQSSLVETLRTAGYATAAFTEGGFVSAHFGFDRGFDTYWEEEGATVLQRIGDPARTSGQGGIERTFDAAIRWLRENGEQPFFLMVHTYEVHMPYRRGLYARELASGNLQETFEGSQWDDVRAGRLRVGEAEVRYVRALYDGGVAAADRHVALLLAALQELGVSDRTVIVATSDHGEDLGERDPRMMGRHGHALYDTLLSVPLIIYDPRFRYPKRRVSAQVRLVDLMPTLLELAGVAAKGPAEGRSLVPLMLGREPEDRVAYSEILRQGTWEVQHSALGDGKYKLIANPPPRPPDTPALELYDLSADPGERSNLADDQRARRNRMAVTLKTERDAIQRAGRTRMDVGEDLPDTLREQLEALGYAQ